MSEKKQSSSSEKNFKQLEKTLKDLEKTAEEYLNGWKRSRADYLNREKEIEEQKQNWIKFANQELILKILPVLDSFDHFLKNHQKDMQKNEWLKGVVQIKKQLTETLEWEGLKKIKTKGENFNPIYHEVIEKRGESGKIIEEAQAGYLIGERVLRPARVIIK